jgi:MoaA/NifB/PqqE/SkfB family radical SAM enzyme
MCPRDAMVHPSIMSIGTLRSVVARLDAGDVSRVVVAGFGEPTTHPQFLECLAVLRSAPVPVDLVTNGQLLDEERLERLDGFVRLLIVSYSSIDPEVYSRVHVNLDHARVTANILLARERLRRTVLAISLTPLAACMPSLPRTIDWLKSHGVTALTMSPTLYNRAGATDASAAPAAPAELRRIIRTHGLISQELHFIPSARDIFEQWRANRYRCIPRNSDLAIAADGSYQYCFDDIRHSHALGHVADMSLREALSARERTGPDPRLCNDCSMRRRYGPLEIGRVALDYMRA